MSLLTVSETSSAIHYNRRQGYTQRQVERIQAAVGAPADGIWGPTTVGKVAGWQKAQGLKVDGKVGPKTMEAIEEAQQCAPVPDRGPKVEIGMGLAAYDQSFPGHRPAQAMKVAFDTSVQLGIREIRYWSSEWIIEDLGNKGNRYAEEFLTSLDVPEGVIVGAWIDDPVYVVKKPAYAERLRACHVTEAALMINRSNTRQHDVPWSLRYEQEDLRQVAENLHNHGIDVICTTWPQPSRSQIDAMCDDMAWILKVCGAKAFEVDTEGNWTDDFLDGFSSMGDAAKYLADSMRKVAEGRRCELTTFTYHRENSGRAQLAPMMDALFPQGYSVRHRNEGPVDFDDLLGPGRHQRLAASRARQAAAA